MKEIINHRPVLQIPPVDIIAAQGGQAANMQRGIQRLNAMAGRRRNPPLQGADPALVQILQMMQNRGANRDNCQKQFLMFPKESFTGQDKKKAKSHWAKFLKYLDYQDQQGTIPRDLAHLPEIKSMFKLTLQYIALRWFETESPTWLTEDQMKQAFLKRFHPWGHTRCQQQDAWNKLKFDMTKDDIDTFVIDMKMLASILGHNDDVITEKFKDIFPDPNIEAALIAMDNFAAMQTKAKQLIQIYKPAHDSPLASAAILVHTAGNTPTKGKSSQPKSNQHQLPLLINHRTHQIQRKQITMGDNADEDVDVIEVHVAVEMEGTLITGMIIKIEEPAVVKDNGTFNIIEGEVQIIHFEGAEDSGMEMTLITVTEITGIEIPKVKVILTGAEDGTIVEVRDIVIGEEGEDGILISNITIQGTTNRPNLQTRIIIVHNPWAISTNTQSHKSNTSTPNNNNTSRKCRQPHHNKLQIFVNCVRVRAIIIINANLQVILWPTHKKPSTKAAHIATKILITWSGHMATLIIMTLIGNLFSSRGSQCH